MGDKWVKKILKAHDDKAKTTDPWLYIKAINHMLERKSHIHEIINDRAAFYEEAAKCIGKDGRLYVEESGMDCDCVKYSGILHTIEPTFRAWDKLNEQVYMDAEGPFYLRMVPADRLQEIKYSSRDLAMEAHEDGHDHIVYY